MTPSGWRSANRLQAPVERSEALGRNVARKALQDVEIGAIAERVGRQFHRPMPQAIGDVVATDDEIAAAGIATVHDDVHVRLIGVVMDGRNVVESRAEIAFHRAHEIARETFQIEIAAALGRDDEAELVPARQAAFGERVDGRLIEFVGAGEELPGLSVESGRVTCHILQMLSNCLARCGCPNRHDACLHDHALRVLACHANAGAARVAGALRSARPVPANGLR